MTNCSSFSLGWTFDRPSLQHHLQPDSEEQIDGGVFRRALRRHAPQLPPLCLVKQHRRNVFSPFKTNFHLHLVPFFTLFCKPHTLTLSGTVTRAIVASNWGVTVPFIWCWRLWIRFDHMRLQLCHFLWLICDISRVLIPDKWYLQVWAAVCVAQQRPGHHHQWHGRRHWVGVRCGLPRVRLQERAGQGGSALRFHLGDVRCRLCRLPSCAPWQPAHTLLRSGRHLLLHLHVRFPVIRHG